MVSAVSKPRQTAIRATAHFVGEFSADTVVDYQTQDFERQLSGYDLVIDSLGGENLESLFEF